MQMQSDPKLGLPRRDRRRAPPVPKSVFIVLPVLLACLALCVFASFALGSRNTTSQELIDGLFHPDVATYGANVVRKRVPRTFFCLLCGAALGVSGALMQAVTRNSIAAPSVLGVNTGAALFIVVGMAFFNISSAKAYIGLAMAGAMLTAIFVYSIGSMGRGGATPIKLVLAGSAVSAAFSSIVSAILLPRSNVMEQYRFWQVGSAGAGTWDYIGLLLPFVVLGLFIAVVSAPALNALALGDDAATGLGVRTGALRLLAALGGVILCASVTALAGPIAFIGLLAPHLVRLLLGADLRVTIPMSALSGALILTVSDVVGRMLTYPGELEVGIVTAFVGAPMLVYAARKAKV
jgi:iron complex transport system permease protein